MDDAQVALLEQITAARRAFSPTAPVSQRDLFAGRTEQLFGLLEAVEEVGQHVVLFGERGVGKTSLVTIASDVLTDNGVSVRVNCLASDDFSTVWRRAFTEITLTSPVMPTGFSQGETTSTMRTVIEALGLPEVLTPDHVRATLNQLARIAQIVVIFDEFDRIEDDSTHREFADCIKALSDHAVGVTVVLVGVADNVEELIAEHGSVERALAQINMPRMNRQELSEIVTRGLQTAGMTVTPVALGRITTMSQGLPHYTHLVAQAAAVNAVRAHRTDVTAEDVKVAIATAIDKTQESIASAYYRATYSARENLYQQVLLACAIASADERGFFSASAVREPLSKILGRRMEIPSFAMHLNAFSSEERGQVLRKEGAQRKFRYRFRNPLLQPYVLMRGIRDGLLDETQLDIG